jgi:hypothetical protein
MHVQFIIFYNYNYNNYLMQSELKGAARTYVY